jgi:aromatic ring-opening dioxygenase catalytic subunit (LigB family)
MGEIVGAALLAHAPTIMLSQEDRYELNEGKEISLVPGLHRFRSEVMDAIRPDTVIVLGPHWFTTVEFCVSGQEHRTGLFTSDELPRGMSQVPYDLKAIPLSPVPSRNAPPPAACAPTRSPIPACRSIIPR